MANEILFSFSPNQSGYFVVFNEANGKIWNRASGSVGFETYTAGNYSGYISVASQLGASPFYEGSFPSGIGAGVYGVFAKSQLAGSGSEADTTVAGGTLNWNGSAVVPLSNMASSGQVSLIGPV